ATVTIVVDERKDVLLVPNAALRFRPQVPGSGPRFFFPGLGQRRAPPAQARAMPRGPSVWVEGPEGPRPISVRPLATDGEWTQVGGEGIEPGTALIVNVAEPPRRIHSSPCVAWTRSTGRARPRSTPSGRSTWRSTRATSWRSWARAEAASRPA